MSQIELTELQRRLIVETQKGLPLVANPYAQIAEQLECTEQQVIDNMQLLQEQGVVRRIGLVPNHYRLGYVHNAMTVWDVDDEYAVELGERVGALEFVSHCYLRPRHLPLWPYHLFAMVHGKTEAEVELQITQIRELLGDHCRQADRLYSSKILKKTGMRLKSKS
ncbi:siroheme decarboxylase subunit beta [Amphritea balenae]|uniref:siroheme decarboxylase n=1 Tax=Amphritea balenae TaxID=452629 RepID=A0A3P1SS83_9GAMM|nr:Lrp/AsnC family transcriptional regulator [Amphritea balenae]RRC99909.1 Lrp/AsnC family transcriptional regulator [Amphritea balenae]GGK75005.1 protein NirH [Amphritea balenae]